MNARPKAAKPRSALQEFKRTQPIGITSKASRGVTAAHLLAAIRVRYPSEMWAFATEVDFGGRRADAVAFGVAKSNAGHIVAFEVKVSVDDVRAELRDPAKMRHTFTHVDEMYAVAPLGMVNVSDLPPGIGLYVYDADGLSLALKSAHKDDMGRIVTPLPLTPTLLAGLVGRIARYAAERR